ncbi:MAG: hypothetical protein KJ558_10210 [Gammaproteobacteria bacterium]|nr:hypothetical protein [Gammaproteobacteria bacterium]MBU1655180.1 hypothetical protein [Gammaproteobacteria bacterium]MBU1959991.1 hypothetical protein [Gammaproteobacteria bacterium]
MKSLVVRFSSKVAAFETTHDRLKDIAEFLGVSQNKAAHYAINKAWESLASNDDMREDLEFKRHGRKVGKVTYLNAPDDLIQRVEERIAKGIPLPHEDDQDLEGSLLFRLLSAEQQNQVRSECSPLAKRRLIVKFLEEQQDKAVAAGEGLS